MKNRVSLLRLFTLGCALLICPTHRSWSQQAVVPPSPEAPAAVAPLESAQTNAAPAPVATPLPESVPTIAISDYHVDDLFAVVKTTAGDIRIHLFGRESPRNVENFVSLALGAKEFVDLTGNKVKRPYYNGLGFFKLISGFIVQAGCLTNTGKNGPGYTVKDEVDSRLKFNEPGIVAMANYGKDTNGSQFFITLRKAPELDGKYTIIGEVVKGFDIVQKISKGQVNGLMRSTNMIEITDVKISQEAGKSGASLSVKGPASVTPEVIQEPTALPTVPETSTVPPSR